MPNYFNAETKVCEQCESGYVFIVDSQSCEQSLYTDWPNLDPKNYWPEEVSAPEPEEGKEPCPPETPYFNGE